MSDEARVNHPMYNLLPTEIEGFESLAELALNLRWSWNHATDDVWRQLDPKLWEITHNPWVVLQTVSRDRIERVLADTALSQEPRGLGANEAERAVGAGMVSEESCGEFPDLRRVLQPGIHGKRSFAHLLGRAR